MAITYTPNLNLGMQLDKTDYVNWDAITQNWQKIDDTAFTGELTVENPFFDINMAKGELKFNQQSAHSGGYQISPTAIFHYNDPLEWCITYRPKFLTSDPVCLLGTVGDYYANPTLEIQQSGTVVWFGFSSNGTSWDFGPSITLDEPLEVGTAYSFVWGIDENGKYYFKIINADTGYVLKSATRAYTNKPNSNPLDRAACLLCNGGDSRFYLTGDIVLSKTYYKENGAVLWGNKAYAVKMEEGDER